MDPCDLKLGALGYGRILHIEPRFNHLGALHVGEGVGFCVKPQRLLSAHSADPQRDAELLLRLFEDNGKKGANRMSQNKCVLGAKVILFKGAAAVAIISLVNIAFAADSGILYAPLPNKSIPVDVKTVECDARLGVSLHAVDPQNAKITGEKSALYAKSFRPTDRLVIELSEDEIFVHLRAFFKAGQFSRGRASPMRVSFSDNEALIANNEYKISNGYASVTVNLNRTTGVGTWIISETNDISASHFPNVESYYLECKPLIN